MAMYGPCTWPCSVHGVTAVYMARTRPWTRLTAMYTVVYTYTRPVYETYIEFATFSQTVVITSANKAKHHIACHRKFVKYGVKRDLG